MSSESLRALAQRMSWWQGKKEDWFHPVSDIAAGLSGEYKEQREKMREADSAAREQAAELKDVLDKMKQAFKYRRIIDVAHWGAEFNRILRRVVKSLSTVDELKPDYIDKYYAGAQEGSYTKDYSIFNDEDEQEVKDKVSSILNEAEIVKAAWFFGDQGEAGRKFLEKIYSGRVRSRNLATTNIINKANEDYKKIMNVFEDLRVIRGKGDISAYIDKKKEINRLQNNFEKLFKTYYGKHIVPLQELQRKEEEKEALKATENKPEVKPEEVKPAAEPEAMPEPAAKQPMPTQTVQAPALPPVDLKPIDKPAGPGLAPAAVPANFKPFTGVGEGDEPPESEWNGEVYDEEPVVQKPAPAPVTPAKPKQLSRTQKRKAVEEGMKAPATSAPATTGSVNEFYNTLVKLAEIDEVPLMVAMAAQYSQQLEDEDDIEGSLKLLAIAEGFIDG
jgi:hypothetical protein